MGLLSYGTRYFIILLYRSNTWYVFPFWLNLDVSKKQPSEKDSKIVADHLITVPLC